MGPKWIQVRPIRRFVLLLDDQPETTEEGEIVVQWGDRVHLDYYVVRVGSEEKVDFGQGDRVVLSDPNAGRKVFMGGVVYRLVRVGDIVAVID